MADKKNEKILVVESQKSMGERIERLLTHAGYEVRLVKSSYPAIATLGGSVALPFALVISSYRIPGMNGDDLLEHARSIAPDTQRMLFAETSDMEILLNAINRAAIHSCIAVPFEDEMFISEVSRRCEHFRQIQKRESLRKLTEHQNRQMYKIALSLKRKREQFKRQIDEKQNIIKMLLSVNPPEIEPQMQADIQIQNDFMFNEFKKAENDIKTFLENVAFDNKLQINPTNAPSEYTLTESYRELVDTIINLFFDNQIPQINKYNSLTIESDLEHRTSILKTPAERSDSTIVYFFKNFNSSGEKSFVSKNSLLAEKVPGRAGLLDVDESNNLIRLSESQEPLFTIGINTRFSDDKLKIFAAADGQPHLDFMGAVSVFPELTIKGDLNYETGDINFNGNITVDGVVKAGCSVKCANLTAQAVEMAQINIIGDLNISSGIIDADIVNVQGNVNARYIHNSRIKALGDIVVQKEIIDSELFTAGQCINKNGRITSSFINARRGVSAGKIGTAKSSPSKIEVGTEGIIEMMIADLDERIQKKSDEIKSLKGEILSFESEENILHGKISDSVSIQDRAQIDLKGIAKQLPQIEASEDIMEVQQMLKMVSELHEQIESSEKVINEAFERQDIIVEQTLIKQRKIDEIESEISNIQLKQRGLKEFSLRSEATAELSVNHNIMAGTVVAGSKSRILLKRDLAGCKIYEENRKHSSQQSYRNIDSERLRETTGAVYEMVVLPFV
ncbi:MAG: DUF342 domain-containing protein [Desulfamplus sp.]|nr:DUF342 domain-containing protein [Desulfamplus sp.]